MGWFLLSVPCPKITNLSVAQGKSTLYSLLLVNTNKLKEELLFTEANHSMQQNVKSSMIRSFRRAYGANLQVQMKKRFSLDASIKAQILQRKTHKNCLS